MEARTTSFGGKTRLVIGASGSPIRSSRVSVSAYFSLNRNQVDAASWDAALSRGQSWRTVPANISAVTGVHTVFLTFTSGQPADFVNVNWLTFAH